MTRRESAWLRAWDELEFECQRLEKALLFLLFGCLVLVLLAQLLFAAIASSPPTLIAALPGALTLPLALIAISAAGARFAPRPAPDQRGSWRAGLVWLLAAMACVLLASAAMRYLAFDLHLGSAGLFSLTGWWQLALIPLVFLLMALRLLRRATEALMPTR